MSAKNNTQNQFTIKKNQCQLHIIKLQVCTKNLLKTPRNSEELNITYDSKP